jgi:hypothetical protein
MVRERERTGQRTHSYWGVKRGFLVDVRAKGKSFTLSSGFTSPVIGLIFVLHR